jgi:sulfur carrier protein ThiS adenylyltransferase
MELTERYSRQSSLIPTDRLREVKILVVGVGAIGRNVSIQLASVGAEQIHLCDFDTVEESNIASQGYLETDLGQPKVHALFQHCMKINSNLRETVEMHNEKFTKEMLKNIKPDVVFACVDSMSTRKFIWECCLDQGVGMFVDGRMAAEALRVISVTFDNLASYEDTLFADTEAYSGPCTAKSTIYCANIAAGFMVASFTKYLRNITAVNFIYDQDIFLRVRDFIIIVI